MRILARTALCVSTNVVMALVVGTLFLLFSDGIEFGPSETLYILSLKIDTIPKYVGVVILTCVVAAITTVINDIGSPNLGFSIYNPTSPKVYGFQRWQLELLGNTQWTSNGLMDIFRASMMVSRFDIAVLSLVATSLTSFIVIRYLTGMKTYIPEYDDEEEEKEAFAELESVDVEI